ncbi:hypothetical protein Avbf_00555 [Armadillidium vulgare]|nr:hypothetical protein Avbf_00555 [Armadillidium vulgare]
MSELVPSFQVANYSKRIQILSLSPFSIEATTHMFNTSHRLRESELKCFYGKLSDRLKKAKTIIGTQRLHRFKPLNENQLEVYVTATEDIPQAADVTADTCLDTDMQIKVNRHFKRVFNKENIVKVLKAPNLIGGFRIKYTFNNQDLKGCDFLEE